MVVQLGGAAIISTAHLGKSTADTHTNQHTKHCTTILTVIRDLPVPFSLPYHVFDDSIRIYQCIQHQLCDRRKVPSISIMYSTPTLRLMISITLLLPSHLSV